MISYDRRVVEERKAWFPKRKKGPNLARLALLLVAITFVLTLLR